MSQEILSPAFKQKNIPIFFSTDENYVLYMGVAIKSLIEHAKNSYNYDICILYETLSDLSKERILSLKKDNVSIRFFNITDYLKDEKSKISYERAHFTIAMYYRIFISDIFKCFDKVLYLDCDIIIKKDVAELYQEDLSESLCAAAPNFGSIQVDNDYLNNYINDVLKISNETYFNSGVMLLNCKKIRNNQIKEKCLQKLSELKTPKYPDQDILNIVCYNQVKLLPLSWNYELVRSNSQEEYINTIYPKYQKEFSQAQKEPYIIHYIGSRKPWYNPEIRWADEFWKYAKMTPWYEQLLTECAVVATNASIQLIAKKRKVIRNALKYKILMLLGPKKKQKHYQEKLHGLNKKLQTIKRLSKK